MGIFTRVKLKTISIMAREDWKKAILFAFLREIGEMENNFSLLKTIIQMGTHMKVKSRMTNPMGEERL